MTPELRAAIERAYRVFSPYSDVFGSKSLEVCRCPCCMYEEAEHALLNTPLREITPLDLGEYTNSAHGWDDNVIAHEFRYFLPRYLELIARYDPLDYIGFTGALCRMGEANWLDKWPEEQVDCIYAFFEALVRATLDDISHDIPGKSKYDTADIEDVLTCIHNAGGDIARMLRVWDTAPDPGAAANMAKIRMRVTWRDGVPCLDNWDADAKMRADGESIAAFVRRMEVDARIEDAVFMTGEVNWQMLMSNALFSGERRPACVSR